MKEPRATHSAGFPTPCSTPACHLGFGVLSVTDHTVVGNKAIHSVFATLNVIFGVLHKEMCKNVYQQLAGVKMGSLTKEAEKRQY